MCVGRCAHQDIPDQGFGPPVHVPPIASFRKAAIFQIALWLFLGTVLIMGHVIGYHFQWFQAEPFQLFTYQSGIVSLLILYITSFSIFMLYAFIGAFQDCQDIQERWNELDEIDEPV